MDENHVVIKLSDYEKLKKELEDKAKVWDYFTKACKFMNDYNRPRVERQEVLRDFLMKHDLSIEVGEYKYGEGKTVLTLNAKQL